MLQNKIHGLIIIVIVFATLSLLSGSVHTAVHNIHKNPRRYILDRLESHDVVLLGTRHKKERILHFISYLIPDLHNAGVTHILFIFQNYRRSINKNCPSRNKPPKRRI
jgi:hypothetical protein